MVEENTEQQTLQTEIEAPSTGEELGVTVVEAQKGDTSLAVIPPIDLTPLSLESSVQPPIDVDLEISEALSILFEAAGDKNLITSVVPKVETEIEFSVRGEASPRKMPRRNAFYFIKGLIAGAKVPRE